MLVADAAVGSIIENSVDANGNVILSAQTINQLKSVSDQTRISFPQIESIIRSKGYTIDTTTPTLTNVDIASENISEHIRRCTNGRYNRIKNSYGISSGGIVTLANQSGISQTELDTILAANNAAPYVGAVASSPQLGTTQGLDEAGLEMPAAEVIDTTTTGTTTTPVEGIASLGQENKTETQ